MFGLLLGRSGSGFADGKAGSLLGKNYCTLIRCGCLGAYDMVDYKSSP